MNKQELIKKIADECAISELTASLVANYVDAEGWLRNPGEPIDPADIKAGDRVRTEFENGTVFELTVPEGWVWTTADYFLLDRPKPELPTEPGSVVRNQRTDDIYVLGKNGRWWCDGYSVNPRRVESIDWEVVA